MEEDEDEDEDKGEEREEWRPERERREDGKLREIFYFI